MPPTNWNRIGELFHAALEHPQTEREVFVTANCGGDAKLRDEVLGMLAAHDGGGRLGIEDRLFAELPSVETDSMIGRTIGAYSLLRLLGRGGMGDVYLAERCDDQYERQVALKLIRPGHMGTGLASRFLQERQILAQLEHPNIAMMLDGGVTESGRPYLVMQYVDGVPITEYCRENGLSLPERLDLFRTVCRAVHVAHINLVVHRDLKPANILVTEAGEVKLLDFGIAKLLDSPEPGLTTSLDRMLTLEHAAPEQVSGQPVTTATDVYALGILLYELLTDERPFEIRSSSPTAIERLICEAEVPAPSTRSGARAQRLRGELDNIVMMALRKEPQRRYQSARELEEDVGNHLAGHIVRAQRDTVGYRVRKFVSRNRWPVTVATVFLVLVTGFVGMLIEKSHEASAERDRALAEQAKAEAVVTVLVDLMEGYDPTRSPSGETLDREDFIAMISLRIEGMDAQPVVQARLSELLGGVQMVHSRYDAAGEAYRRALAYHEGPQGDPIAALRIRHAQAKLTLSLKGYAAAEPLFRKSYREHRELFGPDHRDTGIAAQDLASTLMLSDAASARQLLDEAMAIAAFSAVVDSVGIAGVFNQMGILALKEGDCAGSLESFRRALDLMTASLGEEHPWVLSVMNNLAASENCVGRWKEAEALHRRLLEAQSRVVGKRTKGVARGWDGVANSLAQQGRHDEALVAYGEAEVVLQEVIGPRSSEVSSVIRNQAVVNLAAGRPDVALRLFDAAIAIDAENGDVESRVGSRKVGHRGLALYLVGQREAGLKEGRRALALVDSLSLREADPYRADLRVFLITMLLAEGRAAEAVSLAREALVIRAERRRDPSASLARERSLLAVALAGVGQTQEAAELFRSNRDRALAWGLLYPIQRDLILAASATP